ncbi:(E)-4-hydroxy-3-methylbut-2-enyl-diphosphate synthase (flavodoxin), partial [hydrothermal vent metagenome]
YKYSNSLFQYSRFKTREVFIGDIPLGGDNPIRIQSMTTTDTMNTIATVEQTIRMVNSGCDYVRITAPSIKEAENLKNIKNELRRRGYKVPLIADIHFTPNAAEAAAKIVEKVRVNPGNYVDKKKFDQIEYTDEEYNAEIERIAERFTPLVKVCKEYGTAMRIGTNHGSLSDRIMSRYGDTPLGMVESALEFVRICEANSYYDIVLSMKSSNPSVMVQAYRLLVHKMMEEEMNYPLHLGVTEAGDGEDARIKSAVGIGTLLEDGLGDTVRVSLTEPPENEAPVAINLVKRYSDREKLSVKIPEPSYVKNPFEYFKRSTLNVKNIGSSNVPVVVADFSNIDLNFGNLGAIGYKYNEVNDKWEISDSPADYVYLGDNLSEIELPQSLFAVYDFYTWKNLEEKNSAYPFYRLDDFITAESRSDTLNFVGISINDIKRNSLQEIKSDETVVLVLITANAHGMAEQRRVFLELEEQGIHLPVVIKREYENLTDDQFILYSATDLGGLFLDGFGDGVWLSGKSAATELINRTAFGILQATRTRITKTEYIACPSCGRTLFDLVEVTNKIRNRTEHLKGVKIGIMGCIVNGPGEMADADYGYVGSGVGKITLYRGREVVEKNMDENSAVDRLIQIIKDDGKWVERK